MHFCIPALQEFYGILQYIKTKSHVSYCAVMPKARSKENAG